MAMTERGRKYEIREDYELLIENLKHEVHKNPDYKHRTILRAIKTADSIGLKAAIRDFCRKTFNEI